MCACVGQRGTDVNISSQYGWTFSSISFLIRIIQSWVSCFFFFCITHVTFVYSVLADVSITDIIVAVMCDITLKILNIPKCLWYCRVFTYKCETGTFHFCKLLLIQKNLNLRSPYADSNKSQFSSKRQLPLFFKFRCFWIAHSNVCVSVCFF